MLRAALAGALALVLVGGIPRDSFVTSLSIRPSYLGWAVTTRGVLRTDNGGVGWTTTASPGVGSIGGSFFLDGRRGWVASALAPRGHVAVARTVDGGRTWRRALLPGAYPDGQGPVSLAFANARRGWADVYGVHSMAVTGSTLYATSDGGGSWRRVGNERFDGPIGFTTPRDGWADIGPDGSGLVATHDGGRTWLPVRGLGASVGLPSMLRRGFGVLEARVDLHDSVKIGFRRTLDGGATWRSTPWVSDAGFTRYGSGEAIPFALVSRKHWLLAAGAHLLTSNDGGSTWRRLPADRRLLVTRQLAFESVTTGLALAANGGCRSFKSDCYETATVLVTIDGGRTWSTVLSGFKPNG